MVKPPNTTLVALPTDAITRANEAYGTWLDALTEFDRPLSSPAQCRAVARAARELAEACRELRIQTVWPSTALFVALCTAEDHYLDQARAYELRADELAANTDDEAIDGGAA